MCFISEFRRYFSEKYPSILEGFYQLGELFDKDALARLRQRDLEVFEVKRNQLKQRSSE